MVTLNELLSGFRAFRWAGDIGIEIETESDQSYNYPEFNFWSTHNDGSLRGPRPVEYVLKRPYNISEIPSCLKEFEEKTKGISFKDSVYTSVHIHVNVSRMELVQIFNLMTLWILFEETLVRHCGPDRNGNLFCLKNSNAELQYKTIIDIAQNLFKGYSSYSFQYLDQSSLKYASMNLYCLYKFGSLEFRTFRGTTKRKEIQDWINLLWCLREAAEKYDNPRSILQDVRWHPDDFIKKVFGKHLKLIEAQDLIKDDLRSNMWYGAKIAGCIPNWNIINKVKPLSTTQERMDVEKRISAEMRLKSRVGQGGGSGRTRRPLNQTPSWQEQIQTYVVPGSLVAGTNPVTEVTTTSIEDDEDF